MGFGLRFAKSLRLGKGARISFSRAGASMSTKVGPLRVGLNSRGRSWIAASTSGLTARHAFAARPPAGPIVPPGAVGYPPLWYGMPPPTPPLVLRQYHGWEVATIAGVNALTILAIGAPPDSVGPVFGLALLATVIYALAVDRAGVGTLRGAMRWATMSPGAKTWAVIGWICLYPFFWWYYCGRIVYDWFQARQAARARRPHEIAQMEADLGMRPAVEGACGACGKPLTANAVFCAYCGHEQHPNAQVCPACATLAPPDARFCPQCRAALGG